MMMMVGDVSEVFVWQFVDDVLLAELACFDYFVWVAQAWMVEVVV